MPPVPWYVANSPMAPDDCGAEVRVMAYPQARVPLGTMHDLDRVFPTFSEVDNRQLNLVSP
ncbi:hypothetical protein M407DRAFT_244600 [Tulasnella calospora MUT 4182]|uniref:Uncharacterized protein n=1 Tax=Tulasnella calospora MUT 4182 TaxID=1051891 RepID=A0A0C3QFF5_9AGAM|nr:hypothetical protein M407DRAFT_244600 [Tulasnella calospora MUT 4182]